MTTPTLTPEEQEIMAWGSKSIKASWVALTEAFRRLHNGEDLTREELMIDPYFVPMNINAKLLYYAMKGGLTRAILGDNGSMMSIITNTAGDKIIWAAVEKEEDGLFVEFHPLKERLGADWDAKGAELIYDGRFEDAFHHFAEWIRTQDDISHIDLGILKVANVQFFGAFKKAYEEADSGGKLPLLGVKSADAVNRILQEGWVRFHPEINLKKLLDVIGPTLGVLDPVNTHLQRLLEKLPF